MKIELQIGRRPIKEGFYVFGLILLKNEPQIDRRPIKEDLCLFFNYVEK